MKKLLFFALLATTPSFYGQNTKKPEMVILIDNELATMEQVGKYANDGYIKSMSEGVGEDEAKVSKKVAKLRKDCMDFNYDADPEKKIWND